MNYILQLRAFDDFKLFDTKLSAGQNALWYALMSINNKTNWRPWFTVANSTLENLSGLSRSGIAKDRNILRQLKLIDFQSNGKKAASYHVYTLYTSDSTQDSVQDSTHNSTHSSAHNSVQDGAHSSTHNSSTLTKLNETETKQNKDNNAPSGFDDPVQRKHDEFVNDVWPKFPRQGNLTKTYEAYYESLLEGATKQEIIAGIENYTAAEKIKGTQQGYLHGSQRLMEERCWQDMVDLTALQNGDTDKPRTREDWLGE